MVELLELATIRNHYQNLAPVNGKKNAFLAKFGEIMPKTNSTVKKRAFWPQKLASKGLN